VGSSPDLESEVQDDPDVKFVASSPDLVKGNRDEPDGKVVDSTLGLVLIFRSSWGFRDLTEGRTFSQAGFDTVGCC